MIQGAASEGLELGTVLVLGAGIAGIRAAGDLAAAGHHVLLTDDGPLAEKLLPLLTTPPEPGHSCGLCPLVIPEEEHAVASFYCMRRAATSSANLAVVRAARITRDEGAFRVELDGAPARVAHAVVVAGTTLDDPTAGVRLQRLLDEVPCPAMPPSRFERARTSKPGVFACGAAVGATGIPATLTSGSAAASEASQYLEAIGKRRDRTIGQAPSATGATRRVAVVQQAVVVGTSVAGLRAALSLAQRGIEVQLLEPSAELGAGLPLAPAGDAQAAAFVAALREAVLANPRITLRLDVELVQHAGSVGRFLTVARKRGDAEEALLPHGATILALDPGPAPAAGSPRRAAAPYDGATLARMFAVELASNGHLHEASRFKPVDFLKQGLFFARPVGDLAEAVANGEAAAQRAFRVLAWPELAIDRVVATVRSEDCAACKDCLSLCPYEARQETADGRVVLNEDVCAGCGLCAVYCPSNAAELPGPLDQETVALIEATLAAAHRILP